MPPTSGAPRTVHSVSELTELLRALVEDSLPPLWVEGEISNFARPASGHWYFTLKDAGSQIRCAMFRNLNYLIRPQPANGDQVRVRARASVYPARGELQLIVEHLEAAGSGALLRAFEALKQRLDAEGLFSPALKRPLPPLPRRIGIITSATGAALQDVRHALARRWPLAEALLYPVPVQGAAAAPAIVRALSELPRLGQPDLILLVRGGGSIEDLWAFNEEAVARAIRACVVPVVSGIGHEIDFTIADFAADLRAPTPTAAAELATPDIADWQGRIVQLTRRLERAAVSGQLQRAQQLQRLGARLQQQQPGRRLRDRAQRMDELELRLRRAAQRRLGNAGQRLAALATQLAAHSPGGRLSRHGEQLHTLQLRLLRSQKSQLEQLRASHARMHGLLVSLDPEQVLARGYALVADAAGQLVRDATQVETGQRLDIRVAHGRLQATVLRQGPPD